MHADVANLSLLVFSSSDELLKAIAMLIIGAAGGSFGTIVALGTWRYQVNRDLKEIRDDHTALERRIDRRQLLMLKILADLARKGGVSGRYDDLVVQLLAADSEDGPPNLSSRGDD